MFNDPEPIIIAALLLKPDLFSKDEILAVKPVWFQDPVYADLWNALYQRISEGKKPDIVWVNEYLIQAGHKKYSTAITNAVANILHPDSELMSAVEIIRTHYQRGVLSDLITQTVNKIDSETPVLLAKELGESLTEFTKPDVDIQKIDVMATIIERLNKPVELEWGFPSLDYCTKGASRCIFAVMGAYTSNGKTTMILNMAKNVAKHNVRVHIFSTEMDEIALIEKLATIITGVNPAVHCNLNEAEKQYFLQGVEIAQGLPIQISKTNSLAAIRMGIQRELSRVYFVDYIQSVHPEKYMDSDVKRLGYVARELEIMSKMYNTTIYATSQFHRPPHGVNDVPSIRNFRGSGEIEEAMDLGLILYYPYQQASYEERVKMRENGKDKTMNLAVEKNRRYGIYAKIPLYFDRNTLEIKEYQEEKEQNETST